MADSRGQSIWRRCNIADRACLTTEEVRQLALFAKTIGLEVLLEVHNEVELKHICDEVDLVGVNNRNLKTFDVDINTSLELVGKIPAVNPLWRKVVSVMWKRL
jgi:indole-3-glycerol phosphate synthase